MTFVLGMVVGSVLLGAQQQRQRFGEIDVERINVVERDGSVKMVLTNQERWPDGIVGGRSFTRDSASPGIVFYNQRGDEVGALAWAGRVTDGRIEAGATLNFDQFDQDETVSLIYGDNNGQRTAGLAVYGRPEIPLGVLIERLEAAERIAEGPERAAEMATLREQGSGFRRVLVGKMPDRSAT